MDSLDTSSSSNQTIFVAAGTYEEQVSVPELAGQLYILGETPDTTTYTENTVLVTQSLSQDDGGDNDSTGKYLPLVDADAAFIRFQKTNE